ncbi:leucine-rich repeat protein [Acetobacterium carbinolicum]|uniref:leucine-rich repeat protein n=1 Tax=Acetobacterium carbinolicum TaxID=52690 RepID=UPI0039BFFD6B
MNNKLVYQCALITLLFLWLPLTVWAADNPVGVSYRGHIQDQGDYPLDGSWVDSPEIIGTVGQSKRIEGFEIKLTGTVPEGMELRYNVHVQNKGWLYDENDSADWPKDGAYAGTRGDGLRIEAVKIVLTDRAGKALTGYSVQYRGHVQNVGDLPADKTQWLADGAQLGTVGSSLRLEALLVQVVKTAVDPPEPIEPTVYDKVGTYGPTTGTETVAGDVIVAADGVTLQNLVIQGNLTISEAVGDGNVTLNNVTVKGDTVVRGGGVNSIKINGGAYSRIIMEKTASGAVRIVATDVDGLAVVIAEDATGETIILEGKFDSVEVNAPNMTVTTQGATTTIGTMKVSAGAAGSTVTVAAGTTVSDLVLDGKAAVKGQGTVAKAEVKADGVVFDKKPGSHTVEPGVVIPPVFPTPDSGGGSGGGTPTIIPVTGVSLNKKDLILSFNDTETLVATVAPADATNKAVTWTTSDATIATVDATGKVTGSANKEGTVTITAISADGAQSASCEVTVTKFKVTQTAEGIGMITGMNGNSTDITIPETIGGLTITAIGSNAFMGSTIEKVMIPKSVKVIGYLAFASCYSLRSVDFATDSTLETIGINAFSDSGFNTVAIPKSVKTIGSDAFYNCNQLQSVSFPMDSSLETIGVRAFAGSYVWNMTLPEKVTAIPDQAFSGCRNLSSVTLPSGLTTIGVEAFKNCTQLTDITIPPLVYTIGSAAFDFDAGKEPANRSYTFRGDVPTTLDAGALPTTPQPKIRYYENYVGFTTTDWDGYPDKAVILTQPTNLSAIVACAPTPTVNLTWDPVIGASSYQIGVIDTNSPSTVKNIADTDVNSVVITTDLISGKTYQFSIMARDDDGISKWSQVIPVPIPYPVPVTALSVGVDKLTLVMGHTGQLSATFTPTNATHQKVFWSSLTPGIATVDAVTGMITPVAPGTAIMQGITEDGGFPNTCSVIVTPIPVESVTLDHTILSVGVTKTAQLNATVLPTNAADKTITWSSSNDSIATVDATGKVTGKNEGTATIIVTASNLAGSQTASCAVTVTTSFKVTQTGDGIGTIIGMNGSSTDIDIPEIIDGLTITAIGTGAFQSSAIEFVVIPKTVKEIGYHAFGNCFFMGTVTFAPDSTLETIGASAFANNHMSSLILPNSVTSIGSNAFEGCTILNYITIPVAVTAIPDQAFSGCSNLSSVTLPSGLTAIGTEAFNNCSKLTDIEIPKGVISIGNAAFGFDAGKAPASRSYTFRGDVPGALGASAIPITVTHIPTIKYYENYIGFTTVDWAGYTKAVILEKPTQTDPTATNTGTPTVDLSWAAVTNATGYQVYFSKKSDLSDATIIPVTEAKAKIETGLEPRQLYYFAVKARDADGESLLSDVKSAAIPTVEVTGVSLDKTILSVGVTKTAQLNATVEPANATDPTLEWLFDNLAVATVDANGLVTGISEGTATIRSTTPTHTFYQTCIVTVTESYDVSVTDNKATITKYYGDNKDVVIPDTIDVNGTPIEVVAIGDAAFGKTQAEINSGDMGITAVTIPAKVTSIGTMAFNNCRNLTMVTFDSGSQLSIIGGSSFSGCKSLSNIILPDTVTTIGDYAFGNCSVLKTLALPETLTTIGINAFYFTGLTAITIPSQVTSIPISAFYGCLGLTTIDLPAGLQTIGNTAFAFTDSQTPITRTFTFNGDAPALGTAAIPVSDGTATVTIKYINGSNGFGISPWTDCNLRPIS